MNARDRTVTIPYGDGQLRFDASGTGRLSVVTPNPTEPTPDVVAELKRALDHPIGARPLAEAARGAQDVLILADDLTRQTPVDQMIPLLLDELNKGGISDSQIRVLIALGTHRPMTASEIETRFGHDVISRVEVLNNPWHDFGELANLGVTENGTPVQVSRMAVEADFLIGLGSIVPHHIPGFSAGAKIVQPGISGAATTGATHFLSTRTRRSYLGLVENVVRQEMETIAEQVGLNVILNGVLNADGMLVQAFYGEPRQAFRAGVALSRRVYGVAIDEPADIVIAGSHPCDIEFWQAHKSLYPADIAIKDGGTIILVTPCPEGVAVTHHGMLDYTALDAERIEELILTKEIPDVVSGALALAWAKMRQRAGISIISDGISVEQAWALAFQPYVSVESALDAALAKHGPDASITVLTHAPEMLPILPG